jgi:hypothetical protein
VKHGKCCHFNLSRCTCTHKDDKRDYADLARPEQLNVLADHRGKAALIDLHAAWQPTEFYLLPACRGHVRDATGYSTSREIRTLRTELPEYELRAYLPKRNNWSDQVYDSINRPAYRSATDGLTDSLRTFVAKLSHGWLPISVRERQYSATPNICTQCNESETVPHLYRYQVRAPSRHRFLIHLHMHLVETHTAANIRCMNKGYRELVSHRRHERF